ncbi:M56 family metallopeptidase [Candidatus Hydrogenedentota bacterium]
MLASLNGFADAFITSYAWPLIWQSSLLVVVIAAFSFVAFRRASPQFRYALWLLVILRLFLPPSLYLPTGICNWGSSLLGAVPENVTEVTTVHSMNYATPILVMWAVGVLFLVTFLGYKLCQFRRDNRRLDECPDELSIIVPRYAGILGINRRFDVRLSHTLSSPVVYGILRPVLVVPERVIRELGEEELESVIVHELAHIKRRDYVVNWLQLVAGIAFFFNPFVWFANHQIRIEREKACDDTVLATLGLNRKCYANSLMKVLQQASQREAFTPGLLGVVERRSSLGARIVRILDLKIKPAGSMSLASIVVLVAFACCFLSFRTRVEGKAEGNPPAPVERQNKPAGSVPVTIIPKPRPRPDDMSARRNTDVQLPVMRDPGNFGGTVNNKNREPSVGGGKAFNGSAGGAPGVVFKTSPGNRGRQGPAGMGGAGLIPVATGR